MNFLYIGYYVDSTVLNDILSKNINNMSFARQNLEFYLIKGLHKYLNKNIDFVSYVPINKAFSLPEFSQIDDATIKHIPIEKDNIQSMLSASKNFKKYLQSLGKEKLQNLCIVMYAVNPIFMLPILRLKKKYKFTLTTICSEAPAFRRYNNSLKAQIQKRVTIFLNKHFDNYILLSNKTKEILEDQDKPTMVLEGIAPPNFGEPSYEKKNIVMYAGGLAPDNNISLLIDSCREVEELDELWICGVDCELSEAEQAKVEQIQKEDHRIRYLGTMSNDEVQKLETQAKLLVSLRSPKEKLTRYSFPSKILEYIASGSMVLSTKLAGIPEEYFDYMLCVEQDEKEEIIEKIRYCFSMDDAEYVDFCKKGQQFISEEKNYLQQSKKLIDFLTENR